MDDVEVAFYEGDPTQGGQQIGGTQVIAGTMKTGESGNASVQWVVPEGASAWTVCVKVDPLNLVSERNEENNLACMGVVLPDLYTKEVYGDYLANGTLDLVSTIANKGPVGAGSFTVELRKGSEQGELIDSQTLDGLGGGHKKDILSSIDLTEEGLGDVMEVYIKVDAGGEIEEATEGNNGDLFTVYIDGDSDMMPDWWEMAHELDRYNPDDADEDPDGDNFTNLQEYLDDKDPQNPDSHPVSPTPTPSVGTPTPIPVPTATPGGNCGINLRLLMHGYLDPVTFVQQTATVRVDFCETLIGADSYYRLIDLDESGVGETELPDLAINSYYLLVRQQLSGTTYSGGDIPLGANHLPVITDQAVAFSAGVTAHVDLSDQSDVNFVDAYESPEEEASSPMIAVGTEGRYWQLGGGNADGNTIINITDIGKWDTLLGHNYSDDRGESKFSDEGNFNGNNKIEGYDFNVWKKMMSEGVTYAPLP